MSIAAEAGWLSPVGVATSGRWAWRTPPGWLPWGMLAVAGAGIAFMLSAAVVCSVRCGLAARRWPRSADIRRLAVPGCLCAAAWVVLFVLPIATGSRWVTAAALAASICGWLCMAATAWEAVDAGRYLPTLLRRMDRLPIVLLVLVAIAPAVLSRSKAARFTGDEPSYFQFARSLLEDGDLRMEPGEEEEGSRFLGLPEVARAHYFHNALTPPCHYLGTSFCIMPAVHAARVLGRPGGIFHGYMLLVYGMSVALSALLAWRITGRFGASLAAALVHALSPPAFALSFQIYPEPFVAALMLLAFLQLLPCLRERAHPTRTALAIVLVICVLMPWFHPKFGVLSAGLFAMAVVYPRPWSAGRFVAATLAGVTGLALFLGVHLPIYGDMLWTQSEVKAGIEGIMGLLASAETGMLAYLPWLLVLPFGFAVLRAMCSGHRAGMLLVWPTVVLLVVSGLAVNWGSGGDTVLRYLQPATFLLVPGLAAAFARARGTRLFLAVVLAGICLCASAVVLTDPWAAYPPTPQRGRTLLDESFPSFSWGCLFPHFPYMNRGVDAPWRIAHSFFVVAVCAGFSVVLGMRRLRPGRGFGAAICAIGLLAAGGAWFGSPQWTTTAAKLFQRQCRALARIGRVPFLRDRVDRPDRTASVRFPIAVKPMEIIRGERVTSGSALLFSNLGKEPRPQVVGPTLRLPAGHYRYTVFGSADNLVSTTGSLYLRAWLLRRKNTLEKAGVLAQSEPEMPGTKSGNVLDSGAFEATRKGFLEMWIERIGRYDLWLDSLQLEYNMD